MSWWAVMKIIVLSPSLMTVLNPPSTTLLSRAVFRMHSTAFLSSHCRSPYELLKSHDNSRLVNTLMVRSNYPSTAPLSHVVSDCTPWQSCD